MSPEVIVKLLFWVSVITLCYIYLGYPCIVWLFSRFRARPVQRAAIEPSISVIITAYNEERHLEEKLKNTLALDYPPGKIEVIVASDCSSDSTDEIVREFGSRGVRLHRQPERLGKTAAQNAAVLQAHGDIILFSDATTLYQPDVLRTIVPNFADTSVGCVAGRLIYVDPSESNVGQGAKAYWGYESVLKRHESRACSLIGASGCLYAVRRSAYVPLYNEACSDFIIATKMVEQGLRTVYEPAAVCTEETNTRPDREMRMRVRVITQTYTDLWRHRSMLNPFKAGFYAVQLISHKVLRYLVPILLLSLLVTSTVLAQTSIFFALSAGAQVLFFLTAAISGLLEHFGVSIKLLALPRYFVLANLAALLAFYEFVKGNRYAHWEPIREGGAPLPTGPVTVTPGKDR
jgi:cellulose synthase/poly-beta-1,6-N-acetylglucosamine synthase-like glycosyltransferase